ncbi:MAG TPA: class I SAM-dependent methyltransferase [Candidatus Krumholzibacteria bacterium]|nr:class I SAM-dependent methyltransferase [Candidatus Krumholzibacteria bacterium]
MDPTTAAVRAMYEQYPYPSGAPAHRTASDTELVLSYGALRPPRRPRRVLDAGCGRAVGLLGAASLQPEVHFTGADLNRVALDQAREAARARGLANTAFVECDLMTLAGLDVPAGGFDVIHSSGVLHHLSDPAAGLVRLREVLAPHGMIVMMVYGKQGRRSLMQAAEALAMVTRADEPLPQRVPLARQAAALGRGGLFAGTTFDDTADVDDVELVDRLLNVNETSYDVPAVLALLEAAGLRFVRWCEPADWDPRRVLPDGPLLRRVLQLPEPDQWRWLELMTEPPGLEFVCAHAANAPAAALSADQVPAAELRVHPEVLFETGVRHVPAGARTETLAFRLRRREPVPLRAGPLAQVVLWLRDHPGPHKGDRLLRELRQLGLGADDAVAAVVELVRHEVMYAVV